MRARPSFRRFAGNYLSTLLFIGLTLVIVTQISDFHRGILRSEWRLGSLGFDAIVRIHSVFVWLGILYAIALVPYYWRYPWIHSKASILLRGLSFATRRRRALSLATRQAALTVLLKFFFAPLMLNWCLGHVANLSDSLLNLIEGLRGGAHGRALFDAWLFWACFQLILFADTLLFTIGYLVEVPALRNRIRSVDPTFFGWFICLACYPPFNDFTGRLLEWQSSDFPHFDNDVVHYAVNSTLLVALAIYSWASIALGLKASNLTNRGIVSRGPYAFVRHPAYAAKNFAWWLGALPHLALVFAGGDLRLLAYSIFSLVAWTLIYVLRAVTEEQHLLLGNNGYAEYRERVRWRFIPGLV